MVRTRRGTRGVTILRPEFQSGGPVMKGQLRRSDGNRVKKTVTAVVVACSAFALGLAIPAAAANSGYILQQTAYEYAGNV